MSDEDEKLLQRIAAIEGKINEHKTNPHQTSYAPGTPPTRRYAPPRGRGHGSRFSPYPFRNRTLVVNSSGPSQPKTEDQPSNASSNGNADAPTKWVTKRDRHVQLINNDVYKQKSEQRSRAMEETRKQRALEREQRERAKLSKFLTLVADANDQQTLPNQKAVREILVHDIKFLVTAGGSKLIKAPDQQHVDATIPKKTYIGGVAFLRSKHGNLYRAGLIKTQRSGVFIAAGHQVHNHLTRESYRNMRAPKKLDEPCPRFSSTGSCAKGPDCRYQHDPDKVAICRDFLLTGKCQAGSDCDLSHDPTPERVPACVHFLRGNCTNEDCRYAHVRVNPGAPVCRRFAIYGYCPKGAECPEKHIHECPDYTNKGLCRNKNCRLPHVDRAGQLRKSAAGPAANVAEESSSDLDSDDEHAGDSDDVDSDEFEEEMFNIDADGDYELAQQSDFVKF